MRVNKKDVFELLKVKQKFDCASISKSIDKRDNKQCVYIIYLAILF